METKKDSTLDDLNTLLKDELSAVETYAAALHDRSGLSVQTELTRCQRSHETRARILRDKIVMLGGQPAEKPGMMGTWSKLVEKGAAVISNDMVIRALEQSEDHVLHDYQSRIGNVAPDIRGFLETQLLPEELITHRTLGDLKTRIVGKA